jgi:hypothetical protein
MMDKYQKDKIYIPKNKIKIYSINQMKSSDNKLINEKNKIFKKFILKLRNKIKYTLLTFFNSKK